MTTTGILILIVAILLLITVLFFMFRINKSVTTLKQNILSEISNVKEMGSKIIKASDIKQKVQEVVQPREVINELYPNLFTPGNKWDYRSTVRPGYSGVISMRNIDFPYQELTTPYLRVGTANSESKTDDTIMTLYRRDIAPERDWYEYKVIDTTNGSNIEIYLNPSITYLRNGEKILIPGYENKGEFIVHLDSQYNYIRLNPYPSYHNFY